MNFNNHLSYDEKINLNKKDKYNNAVLLNFKKNIDKVNQKLNSKLILNNSNSKNKIIKTLIKRNNNKSMIQSPLIKKSQTFLKKLDNNYNHKYNYYNNSFCNNSKIVKSKIKKSYSSQEIHKDKKYFKLIKNRPKSNIIMRNKIYNKKLYNTVELNNAKFKNNNNINYKINKYFINKHIFDNHNIKKKIFIFNIKNNNYDFSNFLKDKNVNKDKDKIIKGLNFKNNLKYKSKINLFKEYKNNNNFSNININYNKILKLSNNILSRNNSLNYKKVEKNTDWKNSILDSIIFNINKSINNNNNIFSDDIYHHKNIKMFTILDLYNDKKRKL